MAEVGRAALSIVGMVAGSFVAGPVGAAIGMSLGSIAGGMLFPTKLPNMDQQGPRLQDPTVTGSKYGVGIPRVWGEYLIKGNVIWCGTFNEHVNTTTESADGGKGSKGGGGYSYTTYTYTVSLAVGLCVGPMRRVTKILMDNQVVYDATGTSVQKQVAGLHWRFYSGGEDQLPDSIIEAKEGAGNVPAFRGLCYIVFDELPITAFGNRIPQMQFIVQDAGPTKYLVEPLAHTSTASQVVDFDYGYSYTLRNNGAIEAVDLHTKQIARAGAPRLDGYEINKLIDVTGTGQIVVEFQNQESFYKQSARFALVDEGSMAVERVSGAISGFGWSTLSAVSWYKGLDGNTRTVLAESSTCLIATMAAPPRSPLLVYEFSSEKWLVDTPAPIPFDHLVNFVARGRLYVGNAEIWWLHPSGDGDWEKAILTIITVRDKAVIDPITQNVTFEPQAYFEDVVTLTKEDFGVIDAPAGLMATYSPNPMFTYAGPDNANVDSLIYDYFSDAVIISVYRGRHAACVGRDGQIKWRYHNPDERLPIQLEFGSLISPSTRIGGGTFMMPTRRESVYGVDLIDTRTGAAETFVPTPNLYMTLEMPYSSFDRVVVDGNSLIHLEAAESTGVRVATIIDDLSQEVGQKLNDFSDIADLEVYGYMRPGASSAKSVIEPLAGAYNFDALEAGTILRWIRRDHLPVETIEAGDLVQPSGDDAQWIVETRQQETELPQAVAVSYANRDRLYETETVYRQRYVGNEGYETVRSLNQAQLAIPAAVDPDLAKRAADVILMSAWNGRTTQRFTLPPWGVLFDPGDSLVINIPGDFPRNVLVDKQSVGADNQIEMSSTSEDSSQYTSEVQAQPGIGFIPPIIAATMKTRLYMMPIPYLDDSEDQSRSRLIVHYAMGAYRPGWHDGNLELKQTDDTYKWVGNMPDAAAHGVLDAALAATEHKFCTNDATMRVRLTAGVLNAAPMSDVLAGANALAVFHSDNDVEIIQFVGAELDDEGVYTLTGLLRGRRGTDYLSGRDTPVGTPVVALTTSRVRAHHQSIAFLGNQVTYRGSGFNQDPSAGDVRDVTLAGQDLKPYAPVHVTSVRSEFSGDVFVQWVRRTRLRGDLRAMVADVPLEEGSEAYQVDIFADGALVRTLNAAQTQIEYTLDLQQLDGADHADLMFVVYQMSEEVGRGFPSDPHYLDSGMEVSEACAVALAGLPVPDMAIGQVTAIGLSSLSDLIHVAQDGAIALTEMPEAMQNVAQASVVSLVAAVESPRMEISQDSAVGMYSILGMDNMDIAQSSVIAIRGAT